VNGPVNDTVNRAFRSPFTLAAVNHGWKGFEGLVEVGKLLISSASLLRAEQPRVSGDEVWFTFPPRFGRQERGCPASTTMETRIG
jgi:hypothetical protein